MTIDNVTLENVTLRFRNFSGKAGKFNREGERSFAVLLPQSVASDMAADGWPVKVLEAREEGDDDQPYLSVKVRFDTNGRPPQAILIGSRGRTMLDEDAVGMLDWAEIRNVDMILRPYEWDVNGKTGVTAYLKSIYVTIEEDELDLKYADLPLNGGRAVRFEQD